jgi:hypothetical protein
MTHLVGSYRQKTVFGISLLVVWMISTAYAFWWFQVRPLRPFSNLEQARAVSFDGHAFAQLLQSQELAALPGTLSKITILHFWDPDCPCARFNQVHVRDLISIHGAGDIRFVIVVPAEHAREGDRLRQRAETVFGTGIEVVIDHGELANAVPSSPAAAIFAADRELAYFGPYSIGAVCSQGQGNFVETVLTRLKQGQNPHFLNTMAVGCFCDWPGTQPLVAS